MDRVIYKDEDAEGVRGGWKKCDFGPAGGSFCANDPGIALYDEDRVIIR